MLNCFQMYLLEHAAQVSMNSASHSQTIDFGFSSTSIHWLSKKPCDLEDSVYYGGSSRNDDVRAFKEQAVADWKLFLLQRAAELKPGNTGLIKRVLQV